MRIPYTPNPPPPQSVPHPTRSSCPASSSSSCTTTSTSTAADITTRLQARRYPSPLLSLDLALLHAPLVADGWNSFLGSLRTGTSLPASIRELIICRVAALNGAAYEWVQHAPLARGEGGIGEDGMEVIADVAKTATEDSDVVRESRGERGERTALNQKQWAVLGYADQMTRQIEVDDEVFERLQALFTEQEIVEITATVAGYNCVSRFLVALDVGEMNGRLVGDLGERSEST